MDELRESSLLFSLEGLLETERERVAREAREAQKRRDEEMIRIAEQASRRRLAQEQEREARERRQVLEQERERFEAERIEAMKRATIERARIEAEAQMRLVEAEQARRHELSLSQLREAERSLRYRTLTWLSSAAAVASVIASTSAYFGYVKPAHARDEMQLKSIISTTSERSKTTERELAAERRKNEALREQLRQLEARPTAPAPAPAKPATTGPIKPPVGGGNGGGMTLQACPDDGDPLRACLSGRKR
jgi:hypothetical protein